MQDESEIALNAVLEVKEDIPVNVISRSGKSIAKDLKVSSELTFDGLLEKLPLPQIPVDERYVCFVEGGKTFEGDEGVGSARGEVIVIKRGKKRE
jgi:hypothetical protein